MSELLLTFLWIIKTQPGRLIIIIIEVRERRRKVTASHYINENISHILTFTAKTLSDGELKIFQLNSVQPVQEATDLRSTVDLRPS